MDENKLKVIIEEAVNKAVEPIKEQLNNHDTGLAAINRRLDTNTAAVVELESTIRGYADAYKTNKANIERLDDRVSTLEDRSGITSPPELIIHR